jgi:hypothetical protein
VFETPPALLSKFQLLQCCAFKTRFPCLPALAAEPLATLEAQRSAGSRARQRLSLKHPCMPSARGRGKAPDNLINTIVAGFGLEDVALHPDVLNREPAALVRTPAQ